MVGFLAFHFISNLLLSVPAVVKELEQWPILIVVGDGDSGARAPPNFGKNIFFSDKYHVAFEHFVNFSYIFSGKNVLPLQS